MKVVASEEARAFILGSGGRLWVWLDPHRFPGGGYVYLEAHCEPPGTSRKTKATRSSRRPHRFRRLDAGGFELNYDWGRLQEPDELHVDLRGWPKKRVQAYWNGFIFVGEDVPPPSEQ